MPTSFEDVLKAVETIQSFCDEFNASYAEKIGPLKDEEMPLYETWILYDMIKCLEEVILEFESVQKSDKPEGAPRIPGSAKPEESYKVIESCKDRITKLKDRLEQKLK